MLWIPQKEVFPTEKNKTTNKLKQTKKPPKLKPPQTKQNQQQQKRPEVVNLIKRYAESLPCAHFVSMGHEILQCHRSL